MNIDEYRHSMKVQVRFNEVDMLGVCNNAAFLRYFEDARLQYIRAAGLMPEGGFFTDGALYFIVRNELNYHGHAVYDEELIVYTRVSFVKRSSYGFQHIITRAASGEVITDGAGVVVRVDPATRKSTPLDPEFVARIRAIEPECIFLENA